MEQYKRDNRAEGETYEPCKDNNHWCCRMDFMAKCIEKTNKKCLQLVQNMTKLSIEVIFENKLMKPDLSFILLYLGLGIHQEFTMYSRLSSIGIYT